MVISPAKSDLLEYYKGSAYGAPIRYCVQPEPLSFLLFPVGHPRQFDAVSCDSQGRISQIQVKHPHPASNWIWCALKMPGATFQALFELWRPRRDEYVGTLINGWLPEGGEAAASWSGL